MFYCGLDVSLRETAICIVDADGKIVKELKVSSDPDAIANAIRDSGFVCEKVGLESGSGRTGDPRVSSDLHRCSSCGGDVAGGLAQQI